MNIGEIRSMSMPELKRLWESKRDELVLIKAEIDRRENQVDTTKDIEFTNYLTD